MSNRVSPAERRAFIAERRRTSVTRFDTLHSPDYDENWSAISPSHAALVGRLTDLIRPGGDVLDAACGTGKYWPSVIAAGLRVTGIDQSAGMLAQAHRKHPEIPTRILALQDLASDGNLRHRFDGLLCVDALENVPPEDWPGVATGLAGVLKPRHPPTSQSRYSTVPSLRLPTPARFPANTSKEPTAAITTTRRATRSAIGSLLPGSASKRSGKRTTTGTFSCTVSDSTRPPRRTDASP